MFNLLDIKISSDLYSVVSQDTTLTRVAATGDGEYAGPCPFCGGKDRFHLQLKAPPGKKPEGARWMCRGCSTKWGDVIGYVEKRQNVDFVHAVEWLGKAFKMKPIRDNTHTPNAEVDRERWSRASLVFIDECAIQLFSDEGEKARAWLHRRGLGDDVLRLWQIGFCGKSGSGNPEAWGFSEGESISIPKGIVIPCQDSAGLHYIKIRQSNGEPRYQIIRGGQMWPFGLETYTKTLIGFLFESELDALLAYQTGLNGIGYAALPAGQRIKVEYQQFFKTVSDVIVAYDNDEAGMNATKELCKIPGFRNALPLPAGKDLAEYYKKTDQIETILEYLLEQLGALKGWEST